MSFLRITSKGDPARDPEVVTDKVNLRLARELETRLRPRVDPGIDLRQGAGAVRTVRVAAEGNRLVIEGLGAPPRKQENVAALFQSGTGIPTAVEGRLEFRTATMDPVATVREQEERAYIDGEVQQSLALDWPRYLEDSLREIMSEKPELAFQEEEIT